VIKPIPLQQAPTFWQQASWVAATIGVIVSSIGVIVAAIALSFTARANRQNATAQQESATANRETSKARRATFWLDLRKMFAIHDKVHRKVRPGGEWNKPGNEDDPARGTDDEADLIAYMGLFEHCEYMLEDELIDPGTFKKIYAYRLDLLLKNNRVKNKLARYDSQGRFLQNRSWSKDEEGGWYGLQGLLERFNKLKMLEQPLRARQSSEPPTVPTPTAEQRQRVINYGRKLKDSRPSQDGNSSTEPPS
jgi:hypothetical protein